MKLELTPAQWCRVVQWINVAFWGTLFFSAGVFCIVVTGMVQEPPYTSHVMTIVSLLVFFVWVSMPQFVPGNISLDQFPKFLSEPDYVYQRPGEYLLYNRTGQHMALRSFIDTCKQSGTIPKSCHDVRWEEVGDGRWDFPILVTYTNVIHPSANGTFIEARFTKP